MLRLQGNGLRQIYITALTAAVLALCCPQLAWALIEGCPSDADHAGDKVVIGSVAELVGAVDSRLRRALLAAFEMRFQKAKAELNEEADIIYCDQRPVRDSGAYNAGVVSVLNDEEVLLEVGAHLDGADIMVTYIVIPIRHYAFFGDPPSQENGFHQALYDQSQISSGLEELFKDNTELRLMAALALALRHEKIAEGEHDIVKRSALLDRSRAFYCDAVGSLEGAKPREGFLGLPEDEWQALSDFAHAGTSRVYEMAIGDPDYVGNLSVVASERTGAGGDAAACI